MNSADVERQRIVEVPHVGGRHRDELGKAAIAIHANDFRVRAHVGIAGAAQQAAPVHDVALSRDPVSLFHVGDQAPHPHDLAGKFMADDDRWLDATTGPRIPLIDVDVCSANAGAAHPDEHLILANGRHRDVLQD